MRLKKTKWIRWAKATYPIIWIDLFSLWIDFNGSLMFPAQEPINSKMNKIIIKFKHWIWKHFKENMRSCRPNNDNKRKIWRSVESTRTYNDRATCFKLAILFGFKTVAAWKSCRDSWISPSCLLIKATR